MNNCKYCKADCALRDEENLKECKGHIPMSNADRIRSMSDQELEEFINNFNICDLRTNDECIMSYCGCCGVCVMDWLQQPVEKTADAAAGTAEGGMTYEM